MEKVLNGDSQIAGNMAGGTHHAFRDEGSDIVSLIDLAICAEKHYLKII